MRWFGWLSRRSAPRPFDEVIARLDASLTAASVGGVAVSTSIAMQVATVLACAKVIADGCATPELQIFRELEDGRREVARDVSEYRLLNRRPNEWQTSFEFRRTMTLHAALTGDAVAYKVRVNGKIRELIPVHPSHRVIEKRGRYDVRYRIADEFGPIAELGPADVLHLPNWQWETYKGLDAVRQAAAAIGLAIAAERNQASLHQNGGRPAGLLTTEQALSPETVERIRSAFGKFSAENRNGTAILDAGFSYTPMAMTGVDGQHLETRRFQVEEIARAFGVFPIMIGHSDKTATFASAEAFFAAHVRQTLTPWWQLWRQRLDEFVLDGKGPLFADFDARYLGAGSMRDRAQWARTMAEMGIYTRNELRDEEGKDPLPGLDQPLTPLNMAGGEDDADPKDDIAPEKTDDKGE